MRAPGICPERLQLSQTLAEAIRLTYRAKSSLDSARAAKTGGLDELMAALQLARLNERMAERALRLHQEQHRCK